MSTSHEDHMAYDAFLQFTGGSPLAIKGESTRKGFEQWIEIDYFDFSVEQTISIGSGTTGAGAGKVKFGSFRVRKQPDASSPVLFQACASGTHYDKATVVLNKAGGDKAVVYLKFEFQVVFLEQLHWTGDTTNGDTPGEEITFVYGGLNITYTPQKVDGTPGSAVVGSWDQIRNLA